MKASEKIKNEIYAYAGTQEFFKNNSFETALYILTCAFERRYLDLISTIRLNPDVAAAKVDNLLHNYNRTLRESYDFCEKGALLMSVSQANIDEAITQFERAGKFNLIRNMFEQSKLKHYTPTVDENNTLTFNAKTMYRSVDAELYSRLSSKNMLPTKRSFQRLDDNQELGKLAFDVDILKIWDAKNQLPTSKTAFKKIVNLCVKKLCADNEEQENYNFDTFSAKEFQNVYAVIMALGYINFCYHNVVARLPLVAEVDKCAPIIHKTRRELIDFVCQNSSVTMQKADDIISALTYDAEFHKKKISTYQPLFLFDDVIFYSPSVVFDGFALDKYLYVLTKSGACPQTRTQIANDRESIMIDNITSLLDDSPLYYNANYTLWDSDKSLAEFDLPIYDDEHNKLLLVELKWFVKRDNDKEYHSLENDMLKHQQDRIQKQERLQQHIENAMLDMFNEQMTTPPEIMSCLVSKNYSGGSFLKEDIPVLDENMFVHLLTSNNFDLSKVFEQLKTKSYIPDIQKSGVSFDYERIEYAGYIVNCPAMKIKI